MAYLVSAASGNIGGATLRALLDRGETVRAVSRSDREWPHGVEGVTGDLEDPDGLRAAAEGVDGAFLMSGYPSEAGALQALPPEAHVVLLSSGSIPGGSSENVVTRYHLESERAVMASGRPWTMLQPNSFMTNAFQWKDQLDAGDTVRRAVAATALTEDGHGGQSYRLSGPEALLPEEQVAILGEALDRSLTFEAVPDHEARAEMEAQMPTEYVDAFFEFFSEGTLDETSVWTTVHDVLDRQPGTFAAWARDNAHRF